MTPQGQRSSKEGKRANKKKNRPSTTLPGKLADCSRDPKLCEIYIVEEIQQEVLQSRKR